jgi:hypothetical protein
VGAAVFLLPSLTLDFWWRARQRHEDERLFPEVNTEQK